jgi:predicted extracellular nuclease
LLRAAIKDEKLVQPFEFTVIVNHLKSFRGYDDEEDAPFVRMKKRLQAEFLAGYVNELQKNNPNERIALIGDFNFYQFNDGIMDVIGAIKGTPASKDMVMIASEDLVNPDLINLVDLIRPEQRYSYVFSGNAQVLDHIIVNQALRKHINGFGFARLNADFPEIYRNDGNRVERFSDHDIAVAFFSIDEPKQ